VTITGQAQDALTAGGLSGQLSGQLSGDLSTITGQFDLAASVTVTPEAMQPPGLPVPDDPAAVSLFTAHRVDEVLHKLSHATERLQAARAASGDLRAYHCARVAGHLESALGAMHDLAANLRDHYPAEAAELEQVRQAVGLAKAVSGDAKAATTAHLTETTLHELAHASRHAQAMTGTVPDTEWEFDAEHCQSHLDGALEHAGKLAVHFRDNYPREAKWLAGLEKPGGQDGGTVTAQAAGPETISGQFNLTGDGHGRHIPGTPMVYRHGYKLIAPGGTPSGPAAHSLPWHTDGGDVMNLHGSLGIDRMNMPQVSGLLPDGRYAPSSEMMPKFLEHLKAKGVSVTHERVPASSLKPTQTTGDMRAVKGIAASLASGDLKDTKPVLVSSDNRVIDGHHQWAAHALGTSQGTRTGSAPGEPVIRAGLPAAKLMAEARQFAKDQGIQNRKTGDAANPLYARPSITGQAAPKDSLEKHSRPDGSLTPERAALHEKIIDGILAGHKPQAHPVATFFGGGPAAGKSTALKATPADTAHIDSDEIKAQLPEYQQMLEAKDPRAASFVHEESSAISKAAAAEAVRRRVNFTLDGTGDSDVAKLAAKVSAARKAGYATEGKYVTVGTDEAVRRAKARAAAVGRHVPETFIRETHASVSDTYAKAVAQGLYDRTELYDTTGPQAKLIAGRKPGGKFTVHDPAAYQAFLGKAKERPGS
jgi:predicted ABC-type ATPase